MPKGAQRFLDALEQDVRQSYRVEVRRTDRGLTIPASGYSGFDVALRVVEGGCWVALDGWVEELESLDAGRDILMAALSGEARLAIDTIAGRPRQWTLQLLDTRGDWVSQSSTGRATWMLWGKPGVIYRRNLNRHRETGLIQALPDIETVACDTADAPWPMRTVPAFST